MCEDTHWVETSEREQARKELRGRASGVIEQSIALECGADWETNRKQEPKGEGLVEDGWLEQAVSSIIVTASEKYDL